MLVTVDDVHVSTWSLDDITRCLCGPPGTHVTLQFRRPLPYPPHSRLVTATLRRGPPGQPSTYQL
jgi:hypothetical protein